ncbi:Pycsar system effector family protein [Streptomyces sp. NRRL S-31]|uniref:Pycsar system effector family protein n=1 Tax=Streptomyces sp. NRRL S-31 TaxID=1463898 RepID=UPI0004CB272D|nr:Pycsar system effector family protein [Streptomyces sp. NRRL S-31]
MSITDEVLAAQHAEVRAEIARTDVKAGLLLAFVGAVLAGAWTLARALPMTPAAYVVGEIGLAVLAVTAGLLLHSVRPNLNGRQGFPLWATLTPQQITATAETRDLAADIVGLSRLAVTKFTAVRQAIDLMYAGAALLVLSALIAVGGSL